MSANTNETVVDSAKNPVPSPRLPRIDERLKALPEAVLQEPFRQEPVLPEDRRNPMFELLVQGESDVAGLLAYALYKQNKRDWLIAFQATHGRDPAPAETEAFILGERLPRRTATYRRLADDMLQRGDGPPRSLLGGLMQPPANDSLRAVNAGHPGPTLQQAAKSPVTWRYIAIMLLMLVAMAVLFRLAGAWLFGTPGR